jgi:hypothetical protein
MTVGGPALVRSEAFHLSSINLRRYGSFSWNQYSREVPVENLDYQWQRAFVALLTEIDAEKFATRLSVADDAIFKRLLELEGANNVDVERTALEDTMQDLRLLRNQTYHFRVGK